MSCHNIGSPIRKAAITALILLIPLAAVSQIRPAVKVACIGNSITYGDGMNDRERYAYPSQLQLMLGVGWEVRNFGVSGRTLLKKGDHPYWNESAFADAKGYDPDVVIIKLGTNDSKPWNWKFKDDFNADYENLIDVFQKLQSHPKIYICNPVPAFPGDWGISDSVITADIIPFVKMIAEKKNVSIIDLYSPFAGKPEFFPDKVHPDWDGAREMAREIYKVLCRDFQKVMSPDPLRPVPTLRQLGWHELEYYGFIHFTMNTYTDREWGQGDEPESLFNPTGFDAEEITRTASEAGMSGLIITAKHHDGFCLWPSEYTEHSVKNSPWRSGRGDILRDLSDACRKYNLKFGVYMSPWDCNHKDYGRPEYVTYFRNQLRELLTGYGGIFEVWFDGANGGKGYYGGARETRTIDRRTYYGWEETWNIVRELQPNAVIFSDVGPDIRWVGNESGFAGEKCWSMYSPVGEKGDEPAPGYTRYQEAVEGHRDGRLWLPAECDVSIRPGWFYHEREDTLVKSPQKLFELYLQSVGRNGSLLLNVPLDRRGKFHENDVRSLMKFKDLRDSVFGNNVGKHAKILASNVRGKGRDFAAENLLDGSPDTYWATDDSVTTASMIISLNKKLPVSALLIQEFITLGQRVEEFAVQGWNGKKWEKLASGSTIGRKRIITFPPVKVNKIKVDFLKSKASPVISNLEIY